MKHDPCPFETLTTANSTSWHSTGTSSGTSAQGAIKLGRCRVRKEKKQQLWNHSKFIAWRTSSLCQLYITSLETSCRFVRFSKAVPSCGWQSETSNEPFVTNPFFTHPSNTILTRITSPITVSKLWLLTICASQMRCCDHAAPSLEALKDGVQLNETVLFFSDICITVEKCPIWVRLAKSLSSKEV